MNKSKARITTHPEGKTLEVWTGDVERGYTYTVIHLSDLAYATSDTAPSLDNGWLREWLRELPPDLGPVTIQPDSVVHEADPFTQAAEDGAHMPDEIDPEFGGVISEIKESKGG